MQVKRIIVGPLQTNCYLVIIDNECIIIDPGEDFDKIKQAIGNLKVVGCLLTHSHFDHIGALDQVLNEYNLKLNKVNSNKFEYKTIATPGHTNDSKTYYFEKNNIMFTGDFLFYHSIGRTDLGGNDLDMIKSLEHIKQYPDNTIIYPGHGELSTLKEEKTYFTFYY